MINNYNIFINYKQKNLSTANCWFCSNVLLLRSSFGIPLVLLGLSYRVLKWIRSAFEERSKVMRRNMLFTNIGSSAHKASLMASLSYVWKTRSIVAENSI